MIPYPGVAVALERANGNRPRAREVIREAIMSAAQQQAEVAGRSLRCRQAQHAGDQDGCRNDGTNCICFCHDPKDGT